MMINPSCGILKQVQDDVSLKRAVMLSAVEAWWVGLCALPFDKLRVTADLFADNHSNPPKTK